MTSEEIKAMTAVDLSTNGWLREIALQLSILNEPKATEMPIRRGPGRPPKMQDRRWTAA